MGEEGEERVREVRGEKTRRWGGEMNGVGRWSAGRFSKVALVTETDTAPPAKPGAN